MFRFVGLCFGMLVRFFRGRRSLLLENLALRQQLVTLKRRNPRPSFSLSLRLVWKRCPGRGSAANAKNASTPPLDTDNIGFEPPTRIGNSTWIVRIAFSQTPFPQTVNSPQHKIAREPSSCRQLRDNGKGGIFCFPQFC